MATRIEKARVKAAEAAAKVKELEKKEKAKERQKIEDEKRYKKIGKIVETAAKVKIVDFSTFSDYIRQYGWKIQETQTSASASPDQK